eukprot:Lithocolla_globosa_v1_NODE_626_length_3567_cov_17.757403.p5 type:complete len:102 gc:universal NODE_626_length_3567_cov_17.757403:1038-733(-)
MRALLKKQTTHGTNILKLGELAVKCKTWGGPVNKAAQVDALTTTQNRTSSKKKAVSFENRFFSRENWWQGSRRRTKNYLQKFLGSFRYEKCSFCTGYATNC